MARSAVIWAAALVLAGLSGSGPMLTTAEAMPAPGPQETAGHPRYYFPRHIKRQIVTNSTTPPASTSSSSLSSKSSTASNLNARQSTTEKNTFFESLVSLFESQSFADQSSSAQASEDTVQGGPQSPSPTVSSTQPFGTGVQNAPVLVQPPSSTYTPPAPIPTGRPIGGGSTDGLPPVIVQPTSSSSDTSNGNNVVPPSDPTDDSDSPVVTTNVVVEPTSSPAQPSPQPEVPPTENIGSTGQLPPANEIVQPTPSPDGVGTTGGLPPPNEIVQPTSNPDSPAPIAEPSDTAVPTDNPIVTGPFILPGPTGGLTTSSPLPSESPYVPPSDAVGSSGSTGGVPDTVVLPTSRPVTSDTPSEPLPSSGILVGITTALGTSERPATSSSTPEGGIPTSESISKPENDDTPSATASNSPSDPRPSEIVPGISLSSGAGVTDPAPGPTAPVTSSPAGTTPLPVPPLESILSSVVSDLNPDPEISTTVPETQTESPQPTGSAPIPIESLVSSVVSSLLPTPTQEPLPSSGLPTYAPSETPGVSLPTSAIPSGSTSEIPGLFPSGSGVSSGTGVTPTPTAGLPSSTGIPVSEEPPTSGVSTTNVPIPSSVPPSSVNATTGASDGPVISPSATPTSLPASSSSTLAISFVPPTITPTVSSQPPLASIPATATNSETTFNVGTQIIQEPSTVLPPSATASGIPSDLPKMIQPPTGIPAQPRDSFLGQIGFKWPLNYPFVAANDGGNQIFEYLPPAISDALNLTRDEVVMHGLKPWDTTLTQGFITTLALFYIPADLNGTLAAQLRNPAAAFWHNKNQTVNDLTSLINTAIPLPAGPAAPAGQVPLSGDPGAAPSGYVAGGGPVGGDMDANRKVNPTSAGIATGAVMGAIAYGAAMFFVARRYRNKRLGHKRTSSVANTSRNTYSSLQAGAAFMSGGRGPGRLTPGGRDSRGSRGSSSSQGRSIRTQQISAPVMAENSLGWN